MRRGFGAGAAPSCVALFLEIFACVDTLGEAGSKAWHDCFAQCNAGADVVQAHIWCVVTVGEARQDCLSHCNAGANAAQALDNVQV